MTRYNAAITAQKTGVTGGVGVVGMVIEILVEKFAPGLFPNGLITAATLTVFTAISNWVKNK